MELEEFLKDLEWLAKKHDNSASRDVKVCVAVAHVLLGSIKCGSHEHLFSLVRGFAMQERERLQKITGRR